MDPTSKGRINRKSAQVRLIFRVFIPVFLFDLVFWITPACNEQVVARRFGREKHGAGSGTLHRTVASSFGGAGLTVALEGI
jgi:hypothetical protein